jgi:hypothetical protein
MRAAIEPNQALLVRPDEDETPYKIEGPEYSVIILRELSTEFEFRTHLFDLKRSMLLYQQLYMGVTLSVGLALMLLPITTLSRVYYRQYSMEVALSPMVYLLWILIATTVATFVMLFAECIKAGSALMYKESLKKLGQKVIELAFMISCLRRLGEEGRF